MSVVLPAPLGPSRPNSLARLDGEDHAVERDGLAVSLANVRDFEDRVGHGANIGSRPLLASNVAAHRLRPRWTINMPVPIIVE